MTWWCSATGLPWSWRWTAYPGVWLFLAILTLLYWRFGRSGRKGEAGWFAGGLAILWVALDWPLGALGGYLASAHTGQFILIALSAPALLLLGLRGRLEHLADTVSPAARVLELAARPIPAFLGYNLIMLATHVPDVVDAAMVSQAGSFAIDLLWLVSGLFLWWPVVAPDGFRRLSPPLLMAYLFIQTLPATLPAAFLVFADFPMYRLYELAPRVTTALTPQYDHQVAGLLMKIVGDPVIWVGIAIVFFRWANAERRRDLAATR